MPSCLELTIAHPSWMEVSPSKLHGLGYQLFGDVLVDRVGVISPATKPVGEPPEVATKSRMPADQTGTAGEPFTMWPLRPTSRVNESRLRINWLPDNNLDLDALVGDGPIRFGSAICRLTGLRRSTLLFRDLARIDPARAIRFEFHTPTLFAHNGRNWPVPDPALVIGSLRRRWNANSAVQISDNDVIELLAAIEVDDLDVRLEAGWGRGPGVVQGFVGQCDLRLARSASVSARSIFAALGAASEYLGVGKQTTYGFGVVTAERLG